MKTEFFQKSVLGTALAVLCWLGVPSPINSPAQTSPDNSPPPPSSPMAAGELPTFIYPTSPLAQVIRLSQAGVDQSVILTFIANSSSTFNLDSDKIIYLKDIGLPNEIITAMMQRDQELQQQMAAASQPAPPPAPPPAEITVNYFYDTLAPYGSWITVDGYGRCWRPSVVVYNPTWQPYSDHGRWVYTDNGWYWYSDYSWGWAPFHYGRWLQHSRWGWCWVPDTVWGPSWVTWRYSDGYCGWAPLPPFAVFQPGVGFFYRGAAVSVGFNWGLSDFCFTFVPTRFFCDPHPRRHCLPRTEVTQIFNRTTVINNFHDRDRHPVNRGIDPEHITAVTHTPIRPIPIRTDSAPSGHGPRGDQLSRDGSTLIVSHPPRPGSSMSGRPPKQNDRQTRMPSQPVTPPPGSPAPGRSLHQNDRQTGMPSQPVPPQPGSAVRVPPQHSSPPDQNNRSYSPRQREQLPPSRTAPGSASGAGHHTASGAAVNQPPSPPAQSSAPPPSRSSGQSHNQNRSNDNSGNNSGNGPGSDRGSGPRH
jgi:hypothetical protein